MSRPAPVVAAPRPTPAAVASRAVAPTTAGSLAKELSSPTSEPVASSDEESFSNPSEASITRGNADVKSDAEVENVSNIFNVAFHTN